MKVILTILVLTSVLNINGYCQIIDSVKADNDSVLKRNAVYLEYAGNAPKLSLNFERMFFKKKLFSIYGRLGFGVDIINLKGTLFVPSITLEISSSIGKRKHFVEIGVGSTPFLSKMSMWSSAAYQADLNVDSIDYEFYYLLIVRIGYRYESNKGWLLRFAYTPIVYNSSNINDKYQANFGLAFGKLF